MNLMRSFFVAGFFAIGAVSALAADLPEPACRCRVPAHGGVAGQVVSATGAVQVLGRGPAAQGAPVSVGDRVVVGRNSAATVRVGSNCVVDMPADSDLEIARYGRGLCVRVAGGPAPVGVPPVAVAPALPLGALAIATVVGVGAIAGIVAVSRDSNPRPLSQ